MYDKPMDVIALLLALALVLLNGFFVATEFAIVKIRPTRIEELIRNGRPGAASVRKVVANMDGYLSAAQLGITLASLGLGWIGEPAFARLIEVPLHWLGLTDPEWMSRISLVSTFLIITVLHIVVGEQAPKAFAIMQAETVALATVYPMRLFYAVLFPAIWTLNGGANLILRILGVRDAGHAELHSEEELKIILSQARSAGLMGAARAELLSKALTLPTKTARHMMVPRSEVHFLDVNLSLHENVGRAIAAGRTRFPLCNRELDDVIGIIDIRHVLYEMSEERSLDLEAFAKPAVYFPEMLSGDRLLSEFRARRISVAIIVDEYGGAAGIVTPADLVSAVMGEFNQEADADMVQLPGGAYEVEGIAPLAEMEETLRIPLPVEEDTHTVAGFLMERLGRMPRQGDRVLQNGYSFHVVEVQGPKVRRVRVQRQRQRGPRRPPASTKD